MYYLAVSLLPPTGPEIYCTSFVGVITNRNLQVELQHAFNFRNQEYTIISVSLPHCVTLHYYCISSQVQINGGTTLLELSSQSFAFIDPFYTRSIDLSRGGLVLYGETQDPQLLKRSAGEVNNAFPGLQPPFTPVSLFISMWFQISSANLAVPGVSGYNNYDQHD